MVVIPHNKIFRPLLLLSVVIPVLLLYSCLPEPLDVESIPVIKSKIVVSTQIIPDQSVLVLLTKTFGALEVIDDSNPQKLLDQIAVNDAIVVIEGPHSLDTLVFLDNGTYGGVFIPFVPGEEYHLYINSLALGEARATTQVKRKVAFSQIKAELFNNGYDDTLAEITYTFRDSLEDNWYMINVQEVELEDIVENLLNPRAFTLLVPDQDFNGESFGETFRVFPRDYSPGDTISVSLSNISEAYYRFMKLRIDNRFSFVEFISEPVNYPSNVEGGAGYFNLYIPDVRIFVLE